MLDNITLLQFWYGIFTIVGTQIVIQIANIIINRQKEKAQAPLTTAQSESAMGEALEKLGEAYNRALDTIKSQDEELKSLRPLILEVGLLKQQHVQCQLDKEDWKHYAGKLTEVLEQNSIIPPAFRRISREGDSEKMRAIAQAQVDKYLKKGKGENEGGQ